MNFLAEASSNTCKVTCHHFPIFSLDIKDITTSYYSSKVRTVPGFADGLAMHPVGKLGSLLLPPFTHHQVTVNSYSIVAINHPCSV